MAVAVGRLGGAHTGWWAGQWADWQAAEQYQAFLQRPQRRRVLVVDRSEHVLSEHGCGTTVVTVAVLDGKDLVSMATTG